MLKINPLVNNLKRRQSSAGSPLQTDRIYSSPQGLDHSIPHAQRFFVFVFLYFAQVQIGCHIQRDFSYLYFCILTKSGMDTICTKILCICISVICSSQNWIPFTIYLYFCILLKSWLAKTTIPQGSFVFFLFSQNQICGPLYTTCRENQRHITKPLIQIFKLKFLVPFWIFSALCIHFLCITTNVCFLKSKRDLQFMIVLSFKNGALPIFICFSKAVMRYC